MGQLRDRRPDPARRGDDRAQRRRLRHRPGRAHRNELDFDPGPGTQLPRSSFAVSSPTRRSRPWGPRDHAAAAPHSRAASWPSRLLAAGAAAATPGTRPGRPGRHRVAGHLGRLPGGQLGGAGHGRLRRRAQQLLAGVRPPGPGGRLETGHPAGRGQQRRDRVAASQGGPVPGRRVPAQPGPVTSPRWPSTSDNGAKWRPSPACWTPGWAGPDALAAAPGGGDLIALVPGAVELSRSGGSG